MERTRFIDHDGRRIVLLDYSGLSETGETLQEIEKSREFFAAQEADGALLTLTNVLGARYNTQVVDALKHLTAHNRPYVRAAAVVTNNGLHRIAILTVAMFSKRKLQAFDTLEAAKDWLVKQAA